MPNPRGGPVMRLTAGLAPALLLVAAPLAAQVAPRATVGVAYGNHSSYDHPGIVAVQLTWDLSPSWTIAPTLRHAGEDRDTWRANVVLQHRLGMRRVRPYWGAGVSWTDEVVGPERSPFRGHWGRLASWAWTPRSSRRHGTPRGSAPSPRCAARHTTTPPGNGWPAFGWSCARSRLGTGSGSGPKTLTCWRPPEPNGARCGPTLGAAPPG